MQLKGVRIKAKWTGEKRAPKKGEYYLSGAVIEAYRAKNDLTTPFHIAKLYQVVIADFPIEEIEQ